jgi:Spy/CpxP family protein refolding chaperone
MENKGGNLWKWLTAMLVVCNLALIATVWLRPQTQVQYNIAGGAGHRGPLKYDDKLNLDKEQQAKFREITTAQHARVDSLKRLAKAVREQFFANVSVSSPDQQQIDKLSAQLGDYHRLIELETYNHFRQVRAMLNADQQKIFDEIIKDVLTRMPEQPHFKGDGMGPGGPHRDRPEGQDGPPPGDGPPPADGEGPPPPGR